MGKRKAPDEGDSGAGVHRAATGQAPAAQQKPARQYLEPAWEMNFNHVEDGVPDPFEEPGVVTMYQAAYVDRAWTSGQGWQRGQAPLKYAEGIINDGNFELLTDFVFLLCTEAQLPLPQWLEELQPAEAAAAARGEQHSEEWHLKAEGWYEWCDPLRWEGSGRLCLELDMMKSPMDRTQQRIGVTCQSELKEAVQRAFKVCMVKKWGEQAQACPLDEWTIAVIPHERKELQLPGGLRVDWLTGGGCCELTTLVRLLEGQQVVGKALATYRNSEMGQFGPSLQILEVGKQHRQRGLGTVLLREVERIMAEQFPPILPVSKATLQLSYVTDAHAWFAERGYIYVDPPLNEEAVKEYHPDTRCTCGQCLEGWLSRNMAGQLCAAAEMERDALDGAIRSAEQAGQFGSAGRRAPLDPSEMDLFCSAVKSLPKQVQRTQLYKSFLQGFAECFDTVAWLLGSNRVPTADAVMASWQSEHWRGSAKSFFLERGGSVEVVLQFAIDHARHVAPDDWVGGLYDENGVPRCANDFNFTRAVRELLGPDAQLGRPGCPDCGTYFDSEATGSTSEEDEGSEEDYC